MGSLVTWLGFKIPAEVEGRRFALSSGLSTVVDSWNTVFGVVGRREGGGDIIDDEDEEEGHA